MDKLLLQAVGTALTRTGLLVATGLCNLMLLITDHCRLQANVGSHTKCSGKTLLFVNRLLGTVHFNPCNPGFNSQGGISYLNWGLLDPLGQTSLWVPRTCSCIVTVLEQLSPCGLLQGPGILTVGSCRAAGTVRQTRFPPIHSTRFPQDCGAPCSAGWNLQEQR